MEVLLNISFSVPQYPCTVYSPCVRVRGCVCGGVSAWGCVCVCMDMTWYVFVLAANIRSSLCNRTRCQYLSNVTVTSCRCVRKQLKAYQYSLVLTSFPIASKEDAPFQEKTFFFHFFSPFKKRKNNLQNRRWKLMLWHLVKNCYCSGDCNINIKFGSFSLCDIKSKWKSEKKCFD